MPASQTSSPNPAVTQSLAVARGVGPRLLPKLEKLGLATVEDALYHLPLRYEDRRRLSTVRQLTDQQQQIFVATVQAAGEQTTARARRRIYEVIVGDETGSISLKWFRYRKPWLQKRFPVGQKAVFIGEVKRFGHSREIHHPDAELLGADQSAEKLLEEHSSFFFGRIVPVYGLTEGLTQKQARKIWLPLLEEFAPLVPDCLPAAVRQRHNLLAIPAALQEAHWPAPETSLQQLSAGTSQARQTLVFDEFFFLELGLAMKRAGVRLEQGRGFPCSHKYTIPLNKLLPFALTDAQRRVLGEIKLDMQQPHPMHRLLQGDVGSGKTLVALMAALIAIENRAQVAVVAPTEILAEQHYQTFSNWLQPLDLNAGLLLGSMSESEKKKIREQIAGGGIDLLVGTHAVLQEGVDFADLGLGIIDEQHRFGVRQRSLLKRKGCNPDILVMTATPIPRTLSMTLYGDLAVSVIDQLPPGRKPVTTSLFRPEQRSRAYQLIEQELAAGRQAYVVYPLVEESAKSDLQAATQGADILAQEIFPDACVGLLHGRMNSEERDLVMGQFRAGEIQLLVATTVIEVGVDVPNATVMLIEHADRFGLSQLHQLRGRVGRGATQSYCLLVPSAHFSQDALKRLQVMVESQDGFRIAEADLEIRGPGDFLGTRQAGLPDLRIANPVKDFAVLEQARREAFAYVEQTERLTDPEATEVRRELVRRWGGRLELAGVG